MLKIIVDVLADYGIDAMSIEPLGTGLINQTWLVQREVGEFCVLQKMNRYFPAVVNEDIDVVTRHIAAKGLTTPVLQRAASGKPWFEYFDDTWRVMTYVPGVSRDALENEQQAAEAGRLLAGFHVSVSDLNMQFQNQRPPVHDIERHLRILRDALTQHRDHERIAEARAVADEVLAQAAALPPVPKPPSRLVHGDPKISNLLFNADDDTAVCMVDFDTLTHMPLALELGDAFRSWCNPLSEDAASPEFSLEFFAAALAGYAEGAEGYVAPVEWQCFVSATQNILVELSARFCADALNESYFGWDETRFSGASEHNLVRAKNQLAVYASLLQQLPQTNAILQKTFS